MGWWLSCAASLAAALLFVRGEARAQAASFEALAADARSVALGPLVAPFVDDCRGRKEPIARDRCQASMRILRDTLPGRAFLAVVDDPAIVQVSAYDARIKGVRLDVVGCLACDEPVQGGSSGQKRLVTLEKPEAGNPALADGVKVASEALPLGDVASAKAWMATVRPHLRASFIFSPAGDGWNLGSRRGLAFKMRGVRVFNRCTGEVLYSDPPSERAAEAIGGDGCAADAGPAAAGGARPERLTAADINGGMQAVHDDFDACVARFEPRGTATLKIEVSGATGRPVSVQLSGTLGGTPTGQCLIEAARKAHFPRFQRESQSFSYPVAVPR